MQPRTHSLVQDLLLYLLAIYVKWPHARAARWIGRVWRRPYLCNSGNTHCMDLVFHFGFSYCTADTLFIYIHCVLRKYKYIFLHKCTSSSSFLLLLIFHLLLLLLRLFFFLFFFVVVLFFLIFPFRNTGYFTCQQLQTETLTTSESVLWRVCDGCV